MTRIGLVLGAGGTAGAAFHAGTLLAVQHDLGWSPGSADVIVGSSAGSLVGALIRAGMSTEDLAAWGSAVRPSDAGQRLRQIVDELEAMRTPPRLRGPVWRRPNLRMLGRVLNPLDVDKHTVALSLLPHGLFDMTPALRLVGRALREWPHEPLWITAVRTSDGRRVAFGRDRSAPLGDAVAASCAIPMVYRPAVVDGVRYIDGGVHSPTNADLLAGSGLDLAIVLSPMTGLREALRRRPDRLLRSAFAGRLARECRRLVRAGTTVMVIEPDGPTLDVMGLNAMDRGRAGAVVSQSFLSASHHYTDALKDALRAARAA